MAKKILVIDDDGMITKTIGNLLKREGYNVEVVESGLNAIRKTEEMIFDLIITDIKMPQLDGLETINRIKRYLKKNEKADIPVIFITGYADSDAHIKAEQFGRVIFKPFDTKEFLTEVASALNKG